MKAKIIFGILFVFALMSFVSAVECEDSDGGQNYGVKGIATGILCRFYRTCYY